MIVTERVRPDVFRLPIEKIRAGYKSDIYFAPTKLILERDERRDRVTMQVFQKHPDAVIVGTDQTLALLHVGAGAYRDRARAESLFTRYLDAERRLYAHWLALPRGGGGADAPVAPGGFDIANDLPTLLPPAGQDPAGSSLFDGESAGPRGPLMYIEGG